MNPAWLTELHRHWLAARGRHPESRARAFSRKWEDLLEAASVHTAEGKAVAAREAESLEAAGRLDLRRVPRRRYLIASIALPVTQEAWLRCAFQSNDPVALREHSLHEVGTACAQGHAIYPDLWRGWCDLLAGAFASGRSLRPFSWRQPESVRKLLTLIHSLTSREWPPHTLVRDADVALGLPTKTIEGHRRAIEAGLCQIFGRPTPLEALGIITSNSRLLFDGPLTLHFADGSVDVSGGLRHGDIVTAADLDRAVRITTTATRLLSVENSKTTFRRVAAQNTARNTLIFATSFPTQAVRLLLGKLPLSLPHWHFGDTDPAGYFILLKLRQLTSRSVQPWQMNWQDAVASPALTDYDRRTLNSLLAANEMADCHPSLGQMRASGRKGAFEQEARELNLPL